jgi:serine/threonine protein kinase
MPQVGDVIKQCFFVSCVSSIFVVEKQLTKELFVMKMISIGQEGSEERNKIQNQLESEIRSVIPLGEECPFLVRYLEMFYYENFFCLIIEYCELGDLQRELDSGKHYKEPVFYICFEFLFFFRR